MVGWVISEADPFGNLGTIMGDPSYVYCILYKGNIHTVVLASLLFPLVCACCSFYSLGVLGCPLPHGLIDTGPPPTVLLMHEGIAKPLPRARGRPKSGCPGEVLFPSLQTDAKLPVG